MKKTYISPEQAKDVATIRKDIESGQWVLVSDPIRFNEQGTLLDGQHRLTAILLVQQEKSAGKIADLVWECINAEPRSPSRESLKAIVMAVLTEEKTA